MSVTWEEPKLKRIEARIRESSDSKAIRLLNRAWWKEFFRLMGRKP